jgi:hypothetical protein
MRLPLKRKSREGWARREGGSGCKRGRRRRRRRGRRGSPRAVVGWASGPEGVDRRDGSVQMRESSVLWRLYSCLRRRVGERGGERERRAGCGLKGAGARWRGGGGRGVLAAKEVEGRPGRGEAPAAGCTTVWAWADRRSSNRSDWVGAEWTATTVYGAAPSARRTAGGLTRRAHHPRPSLPATPTGR